MVGVPKLAGKVAIVTGAAQGIGGVYARCLAREGAAVVLCDRADPTAVVDEIVAAGGRAIGSVADATDAAATETLVKQAVEAFGTVDILVNNAALFGGLPRKPFWEISPDEWDLVMKVNTRSILQCSIAVLSVMRNRGSGKIINIASTTALIGTPYLLHYVASKGAVVTMTRAMARELGDSGINVNCIAPGLTMSDAVKEEISPNTLATAVAARAFKREQEPGDLLGALLFFASSASEFITGQTLVVDGGSYMQ